MGSNLPNCVAAALSTGSGLIVDSISGCRKYLGRSRIDGNVLQDIAVTKVCQLGKYGQVLKLDFGTRSYQPVLVQGYRRIGRLSETND